MRMKITTEETSLIGSCKRDGGGSRERLKYREE